MLSTASIVHCHIWTWQCLKVVKLPLVGKKPPHAASGAPTVVLELVYCQATFVGPSKICVERIGQMLHIRFSVLNMLKMRII